MHLLGTLSPLLERRCLLLHRGELTNCRSPLRGIEFVWLSARSGSIRADPVVHRGDRKQSANQGSHKATFVSDAIGQDLPVTNFR
jgi:hypothetical protein